MFINRKWKFVFVHNPKSAGTSIRNLLIMRGMES